MRSDDSVRLPLPLRVFIAVVVSTGAAIILHAARSLDASLLNVYVLALAALTIAGGRFAIKVPGRSATVSVSEVFVFASILLCGAPLPVLTIALDGLWSSLTHRNRRWYRALFNVAEPSISTWAAAAVFYWVAGVAPGATLSTSMPVLLPATAAMAAVFLGLNSGLSAIAVALESSASAYQVWRTHALYLAVNYHAAASLAAMTVTSGSGINFSVVGLVAPLLVLSYVAYRESSRRIDEAQHHIADVEHLYRASVEMLAIAVDAKDQVTHGHIRRVQRHTMAVARALGVSDVPELKAIEAGALLHDIGKLAVPDYVLNKPGALTRAEFENMKKHASMGARILTAVDFPYPIVPIVRHHHEQWNGRGYPDGLVGAEIPLGARILSVVDCFDALTSDRPYRQRMTDDEAVQVLRSRTATFYDPAVVEQFIELIPQLRRADSASHPDEGRAGVITGLSHGADRAAHHADQLMLRTSRTVPAAARELIDEHVGQLGGAVACLFAFDDTQERLIVAHATSRLDSEAARVQIPVGSGVSGWVAVNRSVIQAADPALDIGPLAQRLGVTSCVSVPVFAKLEMFGVLTMYFDDAAVVESAAPSVGLLAQEIGLAIARDATPAGYAAGTRRRFVLADAAK